MSAITVAAIAGTCALTSPAFADWNKGSLGSDVPGANLNTIAVDSSNGIISAGGDGGAVPYLLKREFESSRPEWYEGLSGVTTDIISVVDITNGFYALTKDGKIIKRSNTNHEWEIVSSSLGIDNPLAIAAGSDASHFVVVTSDKLLSTANAFTDVVVRDLVEDTDADVALDVFGKAKGVVYSGAAGKFFVFGDDAKMALVTVAADKNTGSNVTGISTTAVGDDTFGETTAITAMAKASSYWYIGGSEGKLIKTIISTDDGGLTGNTLVPLGIADNINSISAGDGPVYLATDNGKVLWFDGTSWHQRSVDDDKLTGITQIKNGDINYAVVVGENDTSMYSETLNWKTVTLPEGGDPEVITRIKDNVRELYFVADSNKKVFVTEDFSSYVEAKDSVGNEQLASAAFGQVATAFGSSVIVPITSTHAAGEATLYNLFEGKVVTEAKTASAGIDADTVQVAADSAYDLLAVVPGDSCTYLLYAGCSSGKAQQPLVKYAVAADGSIQPGVKATNIKAADTGDTNADVITSIVRAGSSLVWMQKGDSNQLMSAIAADPESGGESVKLELKATESGDVIVPGDNDFVMNFGEGSSGEFGLYNEADNSLYRFDLSGATPGVATKTLDLSDLDSSLCTITKVWGSSLDDFFISDGTRIYHRTPMHTWEKINDENAVTVTSAVPCYSGGSAIVNAGTAFKYTKGNVWNTVGLGIADYADFYSVTAASPNKFITVGGCGLVFTSTDGKNWVKMADTADTISSNNLRSVSAHDEEHFATVSGQNAYIYEEGRWSKADTSSIGQYWFRGIAMTSASEAYVVGQDNDKNDGEFGRAAVYKVASDGSMTKETLGDLEVSKKRFKNIFVLGDNVYVCGDLGVAKYDGSDWSELPLISASIPSFEGKVRDIFARSENEIYVAATGGVYKYDGTKWTDTNMGICGGSIWGTDDLLYAGGFDHNIYRYDGSSWTKEVTGAYVGQDIAGTEEGLKMLVTCGKDHAIMYEGIGEGSSTAAEVFPGQKVKITISEAKTVKKSASELTKHKIPSNLTVIPNLPAHTFHAEVDTAKAIGVFGFAYTPSDSAYKVGDILLEKLITDNYLPFTFSESVVKDKVGVFWMSTDADKATPLAKGTTLEKGVTYHFWFTVQDNSDYDLDKDLKKIYDPVQPVASTSSSGGGGGCVANPAATMGMEWLLMAFAPLLGIFRSRFKKKK